MSHDDITTTRDLESTEGAQEAESQATAPRSRRRTAPRPAVRTRTRASRAAKAAASDGAAEDAEAAAGDLDAAGDSDSAPDPSAAGAASEPTGAGQASAAGETSAPVGGEPQAEAPTKPARRRRTTRTKAAVAPEPEPDPAAEAALGEIETGAGEPTDEAEAEPAEVEAAEVEAAEAEDELTETEPVAEPVAAGEPAAADGITAEAAPAGEEGRTPPVSVIMPVFQPPAPAAAPRRRRAASRPAGPPQVSEQPSAAPTDAALGRPAIDAAGEPPAVGEPVKAAESAEETGTATRARRRRAKRPVETPAEAADGAAIDSTAHAGGDGAAAGGAPAVEVGQVEGEPTAEDEHADQAEGDEEGGGDGRRRRRRRGGRGRRGRQRAGDTDGEESAEADDGPAEGGEPAAEQAEGASAEPAEGEDDEEGTGTRRRRRRRRRSGSGDGEGEPSARESRRGEDVAALRGSTRLEAKKQRRREGREAGRRRAVISEAEFLARRESVERVMVVREREGRTQIGVLEDGVLVEHFVTRASQVSMAGNVYLGKVQNVLPSMEAAFVDIGKGRNAVLYAGEVNWDTAGLEGQPKRIENALKSGESVLVQVTKDPMGHKGARLTSQISLPGRYLVYVPRGSMTGISRKLPDTERSRLKKILRDVVPEDAGVIVRTAAEGASAEELQRDVARLQAQWEDIEKKSRAVNAPALLYGEPDLAIRVVRDIFNEDIASLVVSGDDTWDTLQGYIGHVAPDLAERLHRWDGEGDVFAEHRIDEQLAKALDRKVWLPSGGSLVIDRTEAMTVIDVNTGKFTGAGGNLEETVTKNNLEAAEEIVRQLRLRDIGGIIVIDFIDMVLESNRELVMRRLLECLGRDRTKHQVAEVTSLGLVQMTRKRVGQGLLEAFSETCEHCGGRGLLLHDEPVEKKQGDNSSSSRKSGRERR